MFHRRIGVPFVRTQVTPPAAFSANLQALQAAGHWLPANCGGAPCTTSSSPTALGVSAVWEALTSTDSVQRTSATDTNTKSDWEVRPPSYGLPNP